MRSRERRCDRLDMLRHAGALVLLAPLVLSCDGIVDPIMSDGGFGQLAVGMTHTCGVTAQGSAYCWGRGEEGQLGTGDRSSSATPRRVQMRASFASITAGGAHTCGLDEEGVAYCWGDNRQKQAGSAGADALLTPTEVTTAVRFMRLSAGTTHTCGLSVDGSVYCWGGNGQGQAGAPAGEDVSAPRPVAATRTFRALSAGGFHSCALDDGGLAWCWGANALGQLGDNTSRDSAVPSEVNGGVVFRQISAGYLHTCAVDSGDFAWCWGSSEHGELGSGGVSLPGLPGRLVPGPVHQGERVLSLGSGFHTSCLARVNGLGWCWGRGTEGQLGIGARRSWPTPLEVSDGDRPTGRLLFADVGVGRTHACGLTTVGAIYCWGDGKEGQLGAGALRSSPLAARVVAAR